MRQIEGKSVLLRGSMEIELPRARVIGVQLILIFIQTNFIFLSLTEYMFSEGGEARRCGLALVT